MKIGFVVNQNKTEEAWYDTTLLTSTAVNMGPEVFIMGAGDLAYTKDGLVGATAVKAPSKKFRDLQGYLSAVQGKEAEMILITSKELDVIFLRNNPSEDTGERFRPKPPVFTDVFLLDKPTNKNQIVETIARNGFVIAQEYFPDVKDGDIWVILINGKVFQFD